MTWMWCVVWKYHISMVKPKLSKSIAIMHKAEHLLDRRSGMILHVHLIVSSIIYLTVTVVKCGGTLTVQTFKKTCILHTQKLYESCVMLITSLQCTLPITA